MCTISRCRAERSTLRFLATLLLCAPHAAGQGTPTWVDVSPAPATQQNTPPGRMGSPLAHDSSRGVTVMFGGFDPVANQSLDDLWEWDGSVWTHRPKPATGKWPGARHAHGLAYDAARGQVVLFGGRTTQTGQVHGDTWAWNGSSWTCWPAGGGAPSPRFETTMAYDSQRQRIVLFGGAIGSFTIYDHTYEWSGSSWTIVPPATTTPPRRRSAAMVYDLSSSRMVLFGGKNGPGQTGDLNDTWAWDGADWTNLNPQTPPALTIRHAMGYAYDSARDRFILFGGINGTTYFDETWEFDGTSWMQQAPTSGPSARVFDGALAYDTCRRRTVLFGAFDGSTLFSDTWEYVPFATFTNCVATLTTYGSGCAGSNGTPTLSAAEGPILGQTLMLNLTNLPLCSPAGQPVFGLLGGSKNAWGPTPLPLPLQFLGMPGCDLLVGLDLTIPLINTCGQATWLLPIPLNPGLVGACFHVQAFVVDNQVIPPVNPFGATMSNAATACIGLR